jgi:hypothetical protein
LRLGLLLDLVAFLEEFLSFPIDTLRTGIKKVSHFLPFTLCNIIEYFSFHTYHMHQLLFIFLSPMLVYSLLWCLWFLGVAISMSGWHMITHWFEIVKCWLDGVLHWLKLFINIVICLAKLVLYIHVAKHVSDQIECQSSQQSSGLLHPNVRSSFFKCLDHSLCGCRTLNNLLYTIKGEIPGLKFNSEWFKKIRVLFLGRCHVVGYLCRTSLSALVAVPWVESLSLSYLTLLNAVLDPHLTLIRILK